MDLISFISKDWVYEKNCYSSDPLDFCITLEIEVMLRKIFLTMIFVFCVEDLFAQLTSQNYVFSHKIRGPYTTIKTPFSAYDTTEYTSIDFVEGLGRPIKNVSQKICINENDLIVIITNKEFGIQASDYSPYFEFAGVQDGKFRLTQV